jgi:hypothetical protein
MRILSAGYPYAGAVIRRADEFNASGFEELF